MKVGHKTGKIIYKLSTVMKRNTAEPDYFFEGIRKPPYEPRPNDYATPNIAYYFISTISEDNLAKVIYPNGIAHVIPYNINKFNGRAGERWFWTNVPELPIEPNHKGIYVIVDHDLFVRAEVDRIARREYEDLLQYYSDSDRNLEDIDPVDINDRLFYRNRNQSGFAYDSYLRTVYFIPANDLRMESVFYPELGLTFSLHNIVNSSVKEPLEIESNKKIDGYEDMVEIVDNDRPGMRYYTRSRTGEIITILSVTSRIKPSGIYIKSICNGLLRDLNILDIDGDIEKCGIYRSYEEAQLTTVDKAELEYQKILLDKQHIEYETKQLELKNDELIQKNRTLELQMESLERKIELEERTLRNKNEIEMRLLNMKMNFDIEKLRLERSVLKTKVAADIIIGIQKLKLEAMKTNNECYKYQKEVSISRNNNIKSLLDTGSKIATTIGLFV